MQWLNARFDQHERTEISAVSGMGGVGKTELSLQYALSNQQNYPGGICWIEAREQSIPSQIVTFAKDYLCLEFPKDKKELLEQVQWCWQNWTEGNTLVIFNDATSYAHIKPYLPPAGIGFRILLTTRLNLLKESERLELKVLQPEDAFSLLELLVGKERVQAEADVAKQICQWLGYLPLGLELISRYLTRKLDLTLIEMLARLNAKRLDQRALNKPETESDMTAQLGVAAAFELSWNELGFLAQEIGCFLSIFDVVPIAWSIVEQYLYKTDLEELEDARDEQLLGLHLLQREGNGDYKLHELVREFFQEKLANLSQHNIQRAITQKIAQIAKQDPLTIIKILNKELLDWQWSDNISQPSAFEVGEFILIAQQAWEEGIGPLSQLILEHRVDGSFPTMGVSFYPKYDRQTSEFLTYLQIGLNFSANISDSVIELPSEVNKLWENSFGENNSREDLVTTYSQINWGIKKSNNQSTAEDNCDNTNEEEVSPDFQLNLVNAGWSSFELILFRNQASWPWKQTIQSSVGSLAQYLHERRLPVDTGLLSLEAAWHAACALTRENYLRYAHFSVLVPISIQEIETKLAELDECHFSLMTQYCFNQLRVEVECARQQGETHLQQPRAFREFKANSATSPESLLAYTSYVFEGALIGYQQLIERWFPNVASNFRLSSYLPVRLIGTVVPPVQENKVKVDYFWEPLPNGQSSHVDFKLGEQPSSEDAPRCQTVFSQQEILRPGHRMNRQHTACSWHPFNRAWLGNHPITELTYQWLWADLTYLKWVKGSFNHAGHPYWR